MIYSNSPSELKDKKAVQFLERLVVEKYPQALLLKSILIWHGYGYQKNLVCAFELSMEALNLGAIEALPVISSMYFVGCGCEVDFKKSLDYMLQYYNQPSPPFFNNRIGKVGLGPFELRPEMKFSVNGIELVGSIEMLEEYTRWIYKCKRLTVERQEDILTKNPLALAGTSYRNLPFKGSIGGGAAFVLKGGEQITHVGFVDDWLNEEIYFDVNGFSGWPKGLTFGGIKDFGKLSILQLECLRDAYFKNRGSGDLFRLVLTGTSVHSEAKFYCGDRMLIDIFED